MYTRKSIALSAATVCGLVLCGNARGQDSAGMVRITQAPSSAGASAGTPTPAPEPASVGRATCGHGEACDSAGDCHGGAAHCGIWHTCWFGPDNGYGCRFLDYHSYCMAYPVNPWYYDPRDTRVYAAAGFGAPMTIPIAPTVQTQVNYSWGIPSSRITYISRVTPQPGVIAGAIAPQPYVSAGSAVVSPSMTTGPAAPLPPVMPNAPAPR